MASTPGVNVKFSSLAPLARIPQRDSRTIALMRRCGMGRFSLQTIVGSRCGSPRRQVRSGPPREVVVASQPRLSPSDRMCARLAGDGRSPAAQAGLAKGDGLMKKSPASESVLRTIFRSPKLRRRQCPNVSWLRASSLPCFSTRVTWQQTSAQSIRGPSVQPAAVRCDD